MDFALVVVLHGNSMLPSWLHTLGDRRTVVIRNDTLAQRQQIEGPNVVVRDNDAPAGFAENVNLAIRIASERWEPDAIVVANFDLEMTAKSVDRLVEMLRRANAAACGAALSGSDGLPVFSSGMMVRPASEFLRAAGVRGRKMLATQRLLLRRIPSWQRRNSATLSGGDSRTVPPGEYLPWTLIALSRSWWLTIGELDQRFFMYAEDVDWSIRAHEAGGKLVLADVGPVVHLERVTANRVIDSHYEASHVRLHRKWGFRRAARWQAAGLALRRFTPLRIVLPAVDWALVDAARTEESRAVP